MQLPAPAPLQQNHLRDEHLVATLDHLVQEVRSANEELRRISGNLENILSDARLRVSASNSMEQSSHNSVQSVIPHLLRHQ
jgi:predicted AAA+ superfamily ATPase